MSRTVTPGYCLDPLRIGGRKAPSDPMAKNDAKRLRQCHKIFDLWKQGKYTPSTERKKEPHNAL